MYKTEKRDAKVGEQILIVKPGASFGRYRKNDVLVVKSADRFGRAYVEGIEYAIVPSEYEVIVEEEEE